MAYLRRVYRLPAELEDSLVADLWQSGTLGVATESAPGPAAATVQLTAYFDLEAVPAAALEPLGRPGMAGSAGVECVAEEVLPETDWMAEYRRRAQPFPLGRSLLVDPREPDDAVGVAVAGSRRGPRKLLRIPARTAFGIGSHESTFLAIELLEDEDLVGRSVLDVGTGTGILAFAALAWGAARAVAFDVDPAAVFQAHANRRLNRLTPQLFAGRLAALAPRSDRLALAPPSNRLALAPPSDRLAPAPLSGFDLALVNVVPEKILPEAAGLLPVLAPGGAVILSGLLAERAAEVLARFAELGFGEAARRQAGEWLAAKLARIA
jgi:ribosomal protein L11 methyltransferase